MTRQERAERLSYLRFRMRVIASANLFLYVLKKTYEKNQEKKLMRQHYKIIIEDVDQLQEVSHVGADIMVRVRTVWLCITSLWLWFNLISAPFLCLYPEMSENKTLSYYLWANELVFLLDIIRKLFDKPKKSRAADVYEIAVAYLKSTFILDFVAWFPQVASGLQPRFAALKIIRLY